MSATVTTLTCWYCRKPFTEDRAQAACQACPLSTGCRYLHCPHCGYENPVEPAWLGKLKSWLKFDEAR